MAGRTSVGELLAASTKTVEGLEIHERPASLRSRAFMTLPLVSVGGDGDGRFLPSNDRDADEQHREDGRQERDLAKRLEAGCRLNCRESLTCRRRAGRGTGSDASVVPTTDHRQHEADAEHAGAAHDGKAERARL